MAKQSSSYEGAIKKSLCAGWAWPVPEFVPRATPAGFFLPTGSGYGSKGRRESESEGKGNIEGLVVFWGRGARKGRGEGGTPDLQ